MSLLIESGGAKRGLLLEDGKGRVRESFRLLLVSNDNGLLLEHLRAEGLSPEVSASLADAKKYHTVIINKAQISVQDAELLKGIASAGGTVISILPCETFCSEFGLRRGGRERNCKINAGGDLCQVFGFQDYLAKNKKVIASSMEKKPAVFEIGIGKGKAIVFCFDISETLFRLTHGDDSPSDRDCDGVVRADDGIAVEKQMQMLPQAEALRKLLVGAICRDSIFMPRIWYFPFRKKACVVFTHDDDSATKQQILAVEELDRKLGLESTHFLRIFRLSSLGRLKKQLRDLQMHAVFAYWPRAPVQFRNAIAKMSASAAFLAVQRLLFLAQKNLFCKSAGARGNRNHGLVWNGPSAQPVWMSKAGVEFDSTLGSNADIGYFHAAGLPFFLRHPKTLASLGVLEFPLHIMDTSLEKKFSGKKSRERELGKWKEATLKILADSMQKHNTLTTINAHHAKISSAGDGTTLKWYNAAAAYAKKNDFLIASMGEFNDFWRKHQGVQIEGASIDRENKTASYVIQSQHNIKGLTQLIPASFSGLAVKSASVNGREALAEHIKISGREYLLAECDVEKGQNTAIIKFA